MNAVAANVDVGAEVSATESLGVEERHSGFVGVFWEFVKVVFFSIPKRVRVFTLLPNS